MQKPSSFFIAWRHYVEKFWFQITQVLQKKIFAIVVYTNMLYLINLTFPKKL